MNKKNNMKRLAAISLAVMGIMLVFAQFDAARMNREIKELQKRRSTTHSCLRICCSPIWLRLRPAKRLELLNPQQLRTLRPS